MNCKRCGNELTGKQISFCSQRCSRLYLKAKYKERNRDKVNAYNREYRRQNGGGSNGGYKYHFLEESIIDKCFFCSSNNNLERHHLDYEKQIVVILCRECHRKLHSLLRETVIPKK